MYLRAILRAPYLMPLHQQFPFYSVYGYETSFALIVDVYKVGWYLFIVNAETV